MLRWFLRRQIDAFEKSFGYDASYMREMADASPRALMRFGRVLGLSEFRDDAPLDAWYAAKLAATMHEDCGPCAHINGLPGFLIETADGLLQTNAFEIRDGRIAAIYSVRNPDKLKHLHH